MSASARTGKRILYGQIIAGIKCLTPTLDVQGFLSTETLRTVSSKVIQMLHQPNISIRCDEGYILTIMEDITKAKKNEKL